MLTKNHDPATLWRRQYLATMACEKSRNFYDDEHTAIRFAENPYVWKDDRLRCSQLEIKKNWSVLDIGAGPGTMAIPLAKRCRKVTAVEPSKPMVKILKRNSRIHGLQNIEVVHSRWEDVNEDIGRHDVIIAAYSLMMEDIEGALLKMDRLANKHVHLYWFAGVPFWERIRADLFPIIYKKEYSCSPKCDLIYQVLYNHDIYPDVINLSNGAFPRYRSFTTKEALAELRELLWLNEGVHDDILIDYIKNHYKKDGEDRWLRPDNTVRVRISWRPDHKSRKW